MKAFKARCFGLTLVALLLALFWKEYLALGHC